MQMMKDSNGVEIVGLSRAAMSSMRPTPSWSTPTLTFLAALEQIHWYRMARRLSIAAFWYQIKARNACCADVVLWVQSNFLKKQQTPNAA